jgi:hypothetical protein
MSPDRALEQEAGGRWGDLSTPAGEHRVQFSQCLEDVTAAERQTPDRFLRASRLQTPRYQEPRQHKQRHGNQNGHEHGKNRNRHGDSKRDCLFPRSHREGLAWTPVSSNTSIRLHRQLRGVVPPISAAPPGASTMPTTACPPVWTCSCSTVIFCEPLPRWRLSASSSMAKVRESFPACSSSLLKKPWLWLI